jgi:hypothetical protein
MFIHSLFVSAMKLLLSVMETGKPTSWNLCRVSGDLVSALHDLMPAVIHSQKCPMNIGLIFNNYSTTDNAIQDDMNIT